MSETGSFLNSPGGQVALIGGVALGAWYILKNYGKDLGNNVTDPFSQVFNNVYEGGKDFGGEIAKDTNAAINNLSNQLSGLFDYTGISGALGQGSSQNNNIEAAIAAAKVNLSKEGLLAEVARLKAADAKTVPVATSVTGATIYGLSVNTPAAKAAPYSYADQTGSVPVATSVTGAIIYAPNPKDLGSYLYGTQAVAYGLPVSTPAAKVATPTPTPLTPVVVKVAPAAGYVTTDTAMRGTPAPAQSSTAGSASAQWNAANQIDAATGKYMK